jgi:hypothetical protein
MSLGADQRRFTLMLAQLITYAYDEGYELSVGDAFRDVSVPYGHPDSCHRKRLAMDLNLFKEGKYMTDTKDHLPLGEYWESIGGSWGGRFNDGNHYSIEYKGMR